MLGDQSVAFGQTRVLSLMGRKEEALSLLEDSVREGWRGGVGRHHDWRLFAYYLVEVDAIRDHPRFRAAIATIEADLAQQLENVRAMQQRGEVPTLEDVRALIAARQEGD